MNHPILSQFRANGKLLLTAEYVVLDGALALALPTQLGQSLTISAHDSENIIWKSWNADGEIWFEGVFDVKNLDIKSASDRETAQMLQQILRFGVQHSKNLPIYWGGGFLAETRLEFPRDWGLGSSSTLISMIGDWLSVDKYELLKATFGGSGYDLACASNDTPILFKVGNAPIIKNIDWSISFRDKIYFVHLGKKQNSREGIARYRKKEIAADLVSKFTDLTHQFLKSTDISDFQNLLREHEILIEKIIEMPRAKDLFFSDFEGEIKSLGAWGGDFVLAVSEKPRSDVHDYFKKRGFKTVFDYVDLIKI